MKNLKPMFFPILLLLLLLSSDDQSRAQTHSRRIVQRASRVDLRRLRRLEVQFEQLRSLLRIPGMSAAIVKTKNCCGPKDSVTRMSRSEFPQPPRIPISLERRLDVLWHSNIPTV